MPRPFDGRSRNLLERQFHRVATHSAQTKTRMTRALLLRLKHPSTFRYAFLTAGLLFLATASMAQGRAEEATPAKTETEQSAPDQDGAAAPTLSRDVKQELSKVPSSPDAPARKEEPMKEETGPVLLQPFVEPEPSETPQR